MPDPVDLVRLFLDGGRVVAEAIADPAVTDAWDQPSVLEDLVAHEPWPLPSGPHDLAIAVGTAIAVRRHGHETVVRALYRRGFAAQTLPAL